MEAPATRASKRSDWKGPLTLKRLIHPLSRSTDRLGGNLMFNTIKFNFPGLGRMSVIGGLLFTAVLVLLPTTAGAQCSTGWDTIGRYAIRQRGMRYGFTVELQQKGRVITGTAWGTVDNDDGGVDSLEGTVDGTLDGDSFSVQIFWTNGSTGIYNAKVLPSGRLDGEGYEKNSPNVRVPWNSVGVLKCPPPPPPKPIKSSGKARPSEPAPPPPKPPFITAGQVIIVQPALSFGSVYLGWDGGPDHPNVEIWVSIDNGAEIPAFSIDFAQQSPLWKQPKAGGEMKLQRYRHYKYVLKDAGKTLSTVVVAVP